MKITTIEKNTYGDFPSSKGFPLKDSASASSPLQADSFGNSLKKEKHEKSKKKFSLPVLASTVIGTIIPILLIRKYQGKTIKKGTLEGLDFYPKAKAYLKSFCLQYELKEMLLTSFGSIAGGLFGGLAFDKEKSKKTKIKEAVFQYDNILIPTSIVAGLLSLCEKNKSIKGALPKVASVLLGVGTGMPLAASVSNKINNVFIDKNNPDKRKIHLKDCFVHVDDVVGALVLTKIPLADKLHVEAFLPVLYGMCGYEAGNKK